MPTIESPGSINDFREAHADLDNAELMASYYERLDHYRKSLAEEAGITPQELHDRGSSVVQAILNEAGVI